MVAGIEKETNVQYCNVLVCMLLMLLIFSPSHAAAVLDPETHYKHNFSNNPEYAEALTDAIEKMAETTEDAVQAIQEIGFFQECLGRFNRPTARARASSMSPSKSIVTSYTFFKH